MGRLSRPNSRRLILIARNWLLPIVISGGLVAGISGFASAGTPPTVSELASYLESNELVVGAETAGEYEQIYYVYEGNKIFLTGANYSHRNPVSSGSTIVWQGQINGAGQIYAFDILTEMLVQVTSVGTNQNPSIKDNIIMWETWTGDRWAVSYYDGTFVRQLTNGTSSAVRPRTDGQSIIYAEQSTDGWRTVSYNITTQAFSVIKEGDEASTAYPSFDETGRITSDIANFRM